MTAIAISSGHGKYIRGASGSPVPPQLDEVDEARRVVDRVFELLQDKIKIVKFHDNTSHDQNTNLNTIVNWHNNQVRDKDVSVHFNAYDHTAHGTEVLYVSQEDWADEVCDAIVAAGHFTNRGPKYNGGLFFLNSTDEPAILLEVCFCDNTGDSNLYNQNFEAICKAIAEKVGGVSLGEAPPVEPPSHPPPLEIPDRPEEGQPVRVTVEYPTGVKVKLTKSVSNTGFVAVDIQHPRGVQVDTDVREVEAPEPSGGVPSNQRDIIATVFQDSSTAYDPFDGITDSEMSVSLPGNVKDAAQRDRGVTVWNRTNGKMKTGCKIRDKGPWLVDDDAYLLGEERPLAETCAIEGTPLPRGPHEGKIPNGAGIDLSPALADYLGIDGKGKVDWDWVPHG